MAATMLWYDLETFGVLSHGDRIAQFAAVRTDAQFNPIGEDSKVFVKGDTGGNSSLF